MKIEYLFEKKLKSNKGRELVNNFERLAKIGGKSFKNIELLEK